MGIFQQIPVDEFLDQAIHALTSIDVTELIRLEGMAPQVAVPVDGKRYLNRRAVFAAILDVSGRNLRLLHRATRRRGCGHARPAAR